MYIAILFTFLVEFLPPTLNKNSHDFCKQHTIHYLLTGQNLRDIENGNPEKKVGTITHNHTLAVC